MLEPGQRELLESVAKSRTAAHRLVQRAQVLLRAADGVSNADNAVLAGVTRVTASFQLTRRHGVEGAP
ncbi:hypothetical protein O7626_03890 [Micromonospora sp. WMMD1102]|uniref:hypothetical protein n=1 Tax=Micromonospora sp. WMMD1102 TaxID=3016105 RepID=UPI0024156CBB|nr:hypothetical protein [Micromonospora sp. WMMD1102]MDG4785080.1 hypothetical protein [Micromonospora sp. WMMD1102]